MMPIACGLVGWHAGLGTVAKISKISLFLIFFSVKILGRKIHARNQFSIVAGKKLKTKSDVLFLKL